MKYTTNEVIRALELRLNQKGLPQSNRVYFDCPECHKPQSELKFHLFNITPDNLAFKCFSCDFKGNIFTLAKYLNLFDSQVYRHDTHIVQKTKNTKILTPKSNKPIDFKEVSKILTDLFNNLNQSEHDKIRFYNKRGFDMPIDYKSLSGFKDIKYLFNKYDNDLVNELFRNSKGNFKQLRDKVIIFHRDFNNEIVYYRLYDFSSQKYKKLSSRNIYGQSLSIPFRLELITPDTTHLIITEGEEKADISNKYRLSNQAFISIPGITQQRTLNKIIDKINNKELNITDITVILDKSLKKSLNEEKASINIIEYLRTNLNEGINLNVSELPSPDKSDKNDLDSYLKEIKEDLKQIELQAIISNSYSVTEYRQKYNLVKEDKRERIKHIWKDKKEDKKEFISRDTAQKEYKEDLRKYINSDSNKAYICVLPPGYGKTTITTEIIKDTNKPYIVALPTKKQRNEYAINNGFQILESFTDIIENTINSDSRFNDTEKQEHKNKISKLLSLGLSKAVYSYLTKKEMNLKKVSIDETKTAVITHDYLISHKDLMQDYEGLYIDENITNKLIKSIYIDHKNLTNYKDYSINTTKELDKEDNEDLINFLSLLKEFILSIDHNIERKALNSKLSAFFRSKGKCFNKIIDNLLTQDIRLNEDLIIKKIHTDFENIPSIDFMNDLIRSFKENRVYFTYKQFNLSCFEIKTKHKINNHGKKTIITDGTAQSNLLKNYFDIEKFYNPNVKIDNVKYTLIADKRYSASYLDINEIAKEINEIAGNELTLVTVAKSLINELRPLLKSNITLINFYGSDNKASNEYGHYKKAVCLMPKIDYKEIDKIALCLDSSITDNDFTYQYTPTGYTESNKEHYLNLKTFKHDTPKSILKDSRECEITQSFFRVKRNDDPKEFYLMGDISLKEFNLIPDILITEKNKNPEDKIKNKSDYEALENLFKSSINDLGFFVSSFADFKTSDKAVTLINIDKHNESNNIYNNIDSNVFINNYKPLEPLNVHKNTLNSYLKMLVKKGDYKVLSLPILNNPKHKIYCLPGQEDQAILKAREYFKDVLLSDYMKQDYQNSSLNDTLIDDSINTPTNNLELKNEPKNDNLDYDIKSKNTQNYDLEYNVTNDTYKKEVIAPAGAENSTDYTVNEQKRDNQNSYHEFVNNNLSYLYDLLDKFITEKSLSGALINDNDFEALEEKYIYYVDKELIDELFTYEWLINDITENLQAYNEQIKELIEFNNTNNQIISLKEKYDTYVFENKSYLDKEVKTLIDTTASKDRMIDNKLLDDLLYKAKIHLDNDNLEKSFYYQFLIFNLSENIDKYNLIINKIQVEKDKAISLIELNDIDYKNSYIEVDLQSILTAPAAYNKLPDISDNVKKYLDNLFEPKISVPKELDKPSNDENIIFSSFFNNPGKYKIAQNIDNDIKKIPNIKEQILMRKYISILIIKKINLNNDYFVKLDKWVLQSVDVDELLKRQKIRDFVQEHKKALEYLVS